MTVSDRRWRKVVGLLQVSAASNGRDQVSIWDCWLLQHCVWDDPESRQKVFDWYAARVGAAAAMDPARLTSVVVAWEAKLESFRASRSQKRDAQGHNLFEGADGQPTRARRGAIQAKRDTAPLYLAPSGATEDDYHCAPIQDRTRDGSGYTAAELDRLYVQSSGQYCEFARVSWREEYLADPSSWLTEEADLIPSLEPTRYDEVYVEGCVRQIDELRANLIEYRASLDEHVASLKEEVGRHLWITPEFADQASRSLEGTRATVEQLASRIDKVRSGVESLPRMAAPLRTSPAWAGVHV